jgi:hypothetical protein
MCRVTLLISKTVTSVIILDVIIISANVDFGSLSLKI